jgi:hypothetical protein
MTGDRTSSIGRLDKGLDEAKARLGRSHMTRRNVYAAILAAIVMPACATTAFVSTWKAPDAAPLQLSGSKVAAVAMVQNEAARRAAEDALARELTARGAQGVPMYSIQPDARPDNEQAVRAAVEGAGVHGVVVMRPVGKDKEIVSTPTMYAGPTYGGYWGGYYGYGWGSPWAYGGPVAGGEIHTNTIVSIETLVYSLRQNKLVWAGQSKTTNPTGVDQLVKETSALVAQELRKQGLIPKP